MQTFKDQQEYDEHLKEEFWQKFERMVEEGEDPQEIRQFIRVVEFKSPFLAFEMKRGLEKLV